MFIDTHCHLEEKYYDDISSVIQECLESQVTKLIVSGCELDSISEVVSLIHKYDFIYATVGYHPDQTGKVTMDDIESLRQLVLHDSKVVGIGEIGLDYHYSKENKEEQIELFKRQLHLAEELGVPVVIHSRDAVQDTIDVLKKFHVSGVIHCFSGSLEVARTYIKMGFKLGIGGVVTFKNSHLKDVLEKLDLSSIVLETDSPYLAPSPYRGEKNSPKYIPVIAEFLSNIYHVDISEVASVTSRNAMDVYSGVK